MLDNYLVKVLTYQVTTAYASHLALKDCQENSYEKHIYLLLTLTVRGPNRYMFGVKNLTYRMAGKFDVKFNRSPYASHVPIEACHFLWHLMIELCNNQFVIHCVLSHIKS